MAPYNTKNIMNPIPPAEQKAWNIYFTQALNIVHEVSPSTPIGDIYSAAYKQFESQKWIVNFMSENMTEDAINKMSNLNNEDEVETKKPTALKSKTKSVKKKSVLETPGAKKKLNTYQLFVKYYNWKMKNDKDLQPKYKMQLINQRWKKLTEEGKKRFMEKHEHFFDDK